MASSVIKKIGKQTSVSYTASTDSNGCIPIYQDVNASQKIDPTVYTVDRIIGRETISNNIIGTIRADTQATGLYIRCVNMIGGNVMSVLANTQINFTIYYH